MPVASAVQSRRRRDGKKKTTRGGWMWVLPLLIGIAITPFAVRAASILALEGPKPFALLYPWVVVLRSPALHVPPDAAGMLSQWMMFLQFPLYGMLMSLRFRPGQYHRSFVIVVAAHFLGLVTVVLLAYLAQ